MIAAVTASILVAVDLVLRLVALVVVPRDRRPQTALAWLLAIFFIPYLGIALFFIAGRARLPRKRRRKQAEVNQFILDSTKGFDLVNIDPPLPPWLERTVALNRALGAMPLVGGNAVKLYPDDEEALAAMTAAIGEATTFVHVEFYIMALDATTEPFYEALGAARSRGVRVRVLVDHLGSFKYKGFKKALRKLDDFGIEWHLMLPFQPLRGRIRRPDLRNHRKLLVIDGETAFTGSRNIIDPGYQRRKEPKDGLRWKDLMARFDGPIAAGLNGLFLTDWYMETDETLSTDVSPMRSLSGGVDCQLVPSGPGFEGENNLRMFNSLVYGASEKVIITSPYFVPDDSMLYAITSAAQAGLDVQLFVSEIGDQFMVYHAQRSYYEVLLRAGVKIWLYSSPTILHSKAITIDDEVSVIGSSNMDMRSFSLDLELSMLVRDAGFLADMRAVEQDYRDHSRELTLDEWLKRGVVARAIDDIARLTSAVQ
jgi:cardiolipin synthase